MSYAFFDRSVITNTVQLFVLLFKSKVIFVSVGKFICKTNNIPIVGYFLRPILVQSHRATSQLIDAHARCYSGQINEYVNFRCIPAFTEKSTRSNQTLCQSLLEEFGNHERVVSRNPILSSADYDVVGLFMTRP